MKKLVLTARAKADLEALDRPTRLRLASAIQGLALAKVGDIKKLRGINPPEYRLRVGDFRVRFSYPDPDTIRINRVNNRSDAYR